MQLESTAAMGTTSRGIGIRFTRLALSTIELVPVIHAIVKKLYGTSPQSTKAGNCLLGLGKTFVKTKVSTPIIMSGFMSQQKRHRDILISKVRDQSPQRKNRKLCSRGVGNTFENAKLCPPIIMRVYMRPQKPQGHV